MNKHFLLIWLTVIGMVILTCPISQALVPAVAASSQAETSSDLAHLAQARATTKHAWRVVPSRNLSTSYNALAAVATISANDAWAVGYYDNFNDDSLTLTEHWNGTKWSIVASPNLDPTTNVLEAVAAVSTNDVWVVGYYGPTGPPQRLIEHWNGTKWSSVPNPEHLLGLFGVAAVSANDVWAVGSESMGKGIEHWNGTKWSVVPSPHPGSASLLLSVVAVSATNVWAVGSYYDAVSHTLIEHWDGTRWSVVSSPSPGNEGSSLSGVAAVSANDVWAVGNSINQGNLQSLTEQWNGTNWSIVSSPSPGFSSQLLAVAAISADDVWAVGSKNGSKTLIEQWNGTKWSVVPSPNPGPGGHSLDAVAAISASDVWAVGYYSNINDVQVTLTEHYT